MPLSRSRDYMSIGEVMDAVRDEFPDVSISKIRFLESEGLLEPERTDSGYRKFYDPDVDRLRQILRLQRDHFLPLKVIREKIDAGEQVAAVPKQEIPAGAAKKAPRAAAPDGPPPDMSTVQMDRAELRKSSGLSDDELSALEEFGILAPRDTSYDGDDLLVAKAAKGFFAFGIEPRHLRMYKQFAERETSFFEQIVSPVTHKKNPQGVQQAAEAAGKLQALSRTIREAMLRSKVREML